MAYTEEERDTYIETAQEMGLTRAMRHLGYPKSSATARKWIDAKGVEITVDSLQQKAAQLKHFYDRKEKMLVLQTALERVMEKLEYEDMDTQEIRNLVSSAKEIIQTMELLGGNPTERVENVSSTDLEIKRLVEQFNEQNKEFEAEHGINR